MEFRKMVMMTLYAMQQKRHRCKEQTVGVWEKARVGWFKTIALKHVYYRMWNRSPFQVWCMRQGSQGWCTGMTLKDVMGREVGGGSKWGTHVHPCLSNVNAWQKPLQYYKVISLQLKTNVMSLLFVFFLNNFLNFILFFIFGFAGSSLLHAGFF